MSAVKFTRPTGTVRVCVDASLAAELEDARRRLAEAIRESEGRQSETRLEARAEVERLDAAIRAATVRFVIRGLARVRFQEIAANHPPAKDQPADQFVGMNPETALPDLLAACLVEAVWDETGEPVDFGEAGLDGFLDELTDGQFTAVLLECVGVNRGNPLAPARGATSQTPPTSGTS
jgi:hypothetical protein